MEWASAFEYAIVGKAIGARYIEARSGRRERAEAGLVVLGVRLGVQAGRVAKLGKETA